MGDKLFFYRLACEPTARAVSFSTVAPSWSRHSVWYADLIHNRDVLKWVAMVDTTPVGVVWCERLNGAAEISVNLDPRHHGHGYGSAAIRQAADYAHRDWDVPILAYIKYDNTPSVKAFRSAGFGYWGPATRKDCPALVYRYPETP